MLQASISPIKFLQLDQSKDQLFSSFWFLEAHSAVMTWTYLEIKNYVVICSDNKTKHLQNVLSVFL